MQYTSMSLNQNRMHNVPLGCVSDDSGYLGENLSEPKQNVIRILHFGTGCEPKPHVYNVHTLYLQCPADFNICKEQIFISLLYVLSCWKQRLSQRTKAFIYYVRIVRLKDFHEGLAK